MKTYNINSKQVVNRPLGDVFEFFSRPENLEKITPKNLGFKILTPKPLVMKQGAVIDYTIKLFKVPIHWRTLITSYEPSHMFVDEQMKGPYTLWHHTHIFKETEEGVEILDRVVYAIPFGILGRILHFLWIKKDLKNIFDYRKKIINQFFSNGNKEVYPPTINKASAE
ncbi:MAG: SRPBCC family protein [Candidatus Marinimicrobia bacterium]|nr:SRPBCC family protein [Candidatus Neomarinimicrobiota bacterium]